MFGSGEFTGKLRGEEDKTQRQVFIEVVDDQRVFKL